MLLVIPTKKSLAECTAVLQASETVRELRPILQRAELALGVRVVVRDVRPTMRLGHPQIGQQKSHRFAGHGGATIGVQRELAWTNSLLLATLLDQSFREFSAFPQRHHPARDVAAEQIEDHVEVEIRPFDRTEQLGVSRPGRCSPSPSQNRT